MHMNCVYTGLNTIRISISQIGILSTTTSLNWWEAGELTPPPIMVQRHTWLWGQNKNWGLNPPNPRHIVYRWNFAGRTMSTKLKLMKWLDACELCMQRAAVGAVCDLFIETVKTRRLRNRLERRRCITSACIMFCIWQLDVLRIFCSP